MMFFHTVAVEQMLKDLGLSQASSIRYTGEHKTLPSNVK